MASRNIRGQSSSSGGPQQTNRQNEYFVPRDGIDREVITADICRYLGNDALVRPGNYDNGGRVIQGYYITAYRNLTTAMIADLKADSARWDQERRNHSGAVRYSDSQYRTGGATTQYPGSDAPGYSAGGQGNVRNSGGYQQQSYGQSGGYPHSHSSQQYPQQQQQPGYATQTPDRFSGAQPGAAGYGQVYSNHPTGQEQPYLATGAHSLVQQPDYSRRDVSMSEAPSRSVYPPGTSQAVYGSAQNPAYSSYTTQAQAPVSSTGYAPQPVDAFYGRQPYNATIPGSQAATTEYVASPTHPVSYSPAPDQYENQAPPPPRPAIASSSSTQAQTGNSGSSGQRRDRERDRDSERPSADRRSRHHHHR